MTPKIPVTVLGGGSDSASCVAQQPASGSAARGAVRQAEGRSRRSSTTHQTPRSTP